MEKVTGEDGKDKLVARDFVWFTYAECQKNIDAIGAAMVHFNMAPENDLGVRGGCGRRFGAGEGFAGAVFGGRCAEHG
jgi:hypothetical protein